jgi:hypothetical protein
VLTAFAALALLAVRAGRGIMPSWRSDEPVSVEAEVTSTFCGGNAGPNDYHLAVDIVAIDGGIVAWLERRGSRQDRCQAATGLGQDTHPQRPRPDQD